MNASEQNMFRRNIFGVIGITIALMGIGVAIFQDDIRAQLDTQPVEVQDRILEKGAKLLGLEVESERSRDWVTFTQFGLGFIGIILGVISWVRNENHRISASAAALGVVAIAWVYVLIGLAIGVILLVVGSFS